MGLTVPPRATTSADPRVDASPPGGSWLTRPRAHVSAIMVTTFVAAVAAASMVVWWVNVTRLEAASTPGGGRVPWLVLALLFYFAESHVVHLHFRNQAHTLSASDVALVLGLFFSTSAGLLAAQIVGAALALGLRRRQRSIKLIFNIAELSLTSGIALLVFRSLVDPSGPRAQTWAIALLAVAAAHASGALLVAAVMSVAEGNAEVPRADRTLLVSLLGALSMASLGLLAVELRSTDPVAVLLVAGPIVACWVALRAYWRQRQERDQLDFLYQSMRTIQAAPELGLAVEELLISARGLLRAGYAEILLVSPTNGEAPLRSSSTPGATELMQRAAFTPAEEQALRQISSSGQSVLLPSKRQRHALDDLISARGLPDAIIGCLRAENDVMGWLLVGGRVTDVSTFGADDLTVFETFVGHASMLLENGRLEHSLAEVTQLKEELTFQAYHDALTGLPNRLLFHQTVTDALASDTTPSPGTHTVLFLDLNRFKEVNDRYGHSAGDEVLQLAAERIRGCLRPTDTPARLGGDEFAVLLPNTGDNGADRVAGRIADAFTAPFQLSSGPQATVWVSIGIAVTGPDATTTEAMLVNADLAMYTAKGADRGRSHYQPALHAEWRHNRETICELEKAVERGEIIAHFQPVISLSDGTIQAFEALARWQHPTRGLLPPSEFLDLAESSGLITEVGAGVRRHAFRCAEEWRGVNPVAATTRLWVNVSPTELTNDRLIEDLALALTCARLDAERLTVEITESTVIRDEDGAHRAMNQLREIGVHLSIDDFGTGYSSLARLAEFPIDMLKIPKPFVDRLLGINPDVTFVDAILRLAGSLGLSTCSEGIEHAAQARQLIDLGCDFAQGYLYCKPVPEEEALNLLRRGVVLGHAPGPASPRYSGDGVTWRLPART